MNNNLHKILSHIDTAMNKYTKEQLIQNEISKDLAARLTESESAYHMHASLIRCPDDRFECVLWNYDVEPEYDDMIMINWYDSHDVGWIEYPAK